MVTLPDELKLVLEGLIQLPLESEITECSSVTQITPSIKLEEDVGYLPFLIELYIPNGSSSLGYSYMARKRVGYYYLTRIKDEPQRLDISINTSISKFIGIHIFIKGLEDWKGKEHRVIITTTQDAYLLDMYSPNDSNLLFFKDSLFIYTGIGELSSICIRH
jgi:hypothetical protein